MPMAAMRITNALRQLALLLACLGLAALPAHAVERSDLEAAIVFNILLFVDWPPQASPAPGGTLVLCLDTASRLAPPLRSLAGNRLRSYRLEVHELNAGDSLHGCHALFIDAGARLPAATLRRQLRGTPVLVIADQAGVADDAVAVRLGETDGRVAFDVDLAVARTAGLSISSRLLRLAHKVVE